jgi:cyclopropane-fatty-acyl-phospholipid synthase
MSQVSSSQISSSPVYSSQLSSPHVASSQAASGALLLDGRSRVAPPARQRPVPVGARPPAVLQELTARADVSLNGERPWDMRVHDPALYRRILTAGSLGLGEGYMDGQWDAERLDETMARLLGAGADVVVEGSGSWLLRLRVALAVLVTRLVNRQTGRRAFAVGERHYDAGNDLYRRMLDPTMSYSCGYWARADDLAGAQQAKLELICEKLGLAPGQRVLDVGCGWGGFAEHAARTRGVEVLGVTVSREQAALARERCAGLPVEIRLQDYRDVRGSFDRVVSVGMFEHVGQRNYAGYFARIASWLKPDGLCLLQTIGTRSRHAFNDAWFEKYIFPNSELPNAEGIAAACRPQLVLEDWHAFGADYDRTLLAWWDNVRRHLPELRAAGYDERFLRMWHFYLMASAGFFRSRRGQLWQLVLSRPERAEVYRSVR